LPGCGLELGDEMQLTFRPLKDTFSVIFGMASIHRSLEKLPDLPGYLQIVGLYNRTSCCALYAYIPTNSCSRALHHHLKNNLSGKTGYSFVLDSSRHEAEFVQAYKDPLQELGINLTFLANNGPAYWAAVDPIRRSMSAEVLVFGLLMIVALILAVFLYVMQRKRDYAILRALGVPVKQANAQLVLPLLLVGGLGIIVGGLPAWNYALDQAKATLSTLPMPSGVSPSADLSPLYLAGLCFAIFLLLGAFSRLGAFFLSRKPVYELLQDQSTRPAKGKNGKEPAHSASRLLPCLHPGWHGRRSLGARRQQPLRTGPIGCAEKIHAFVLESVCAPSCAAFQAQIRFDPCHCPGLYACLGLDPADHGAQSAGN
jgi:hypothetical protein